MPSWPTRSPVPAAQPVRLRIVGEVAAGDDPTFRVGPGEAARIMTGAKLPEGADAVIAVEDTDGAAEGEVECRAVARRGRYVRPRGEDVAAGAVVVSAGEIVGPRTIAVLAACGHADGRGAPPAARRRAVHR